MSLRENARIEFYRFELKHKSQDEKKFKDFAKEVLNTTGTDSDIMKSYLTYFVQSLDRGVGRDKKFKKEIILDEKKNKYIKHRPKIHSNSNIISGVINGGSFGRDRILVEEDKDKVPQTIDLSSTVMQYYYFLLYLPLDHSEGFFIIHSNGREENITNVFKGFVEKIFTFNKEYRKPITRRFSPKSFQEEFMKNALIQEISFANTEVLDINENEKINIDEKEFQVRITIKPKSKYKIDQRKDLLDYFKKYMFGIKNNSPTIGSFGRISFLTKSQTNNSTKTFEATSIEDDFYPVIKLQDHINKFNKDDTPDFEELDRYCIDLFENKIRKEFRTGGISEHDD